MNHLQKLIDEHAAANREDGAAGVAWSKDTANKHTALTLALADLHTLLQDT